MKRKIWLLLLLWLSSTTVLYAQENSLSLRLSRDFGYGSGAQVRGTFSYRVTGPEDLERVVFLLDNETIGEDTEAPFRLQFHTENYALGEHTLSAIGYTSSGAELHSNTLQRNFVSSSQANNVILWIVVPIVILAVGGRFIAARLANRNRREDGKPAISGTWGGTICPNCGRPYAIHFWSFKLVVARLDRCPHCGKWKMVRRMPQEMLEAAAEAWETTDAAPATKEAPENAEQKLQDQLDDSRFDDVV